MSRKKKETIVGINGTEVTKDEAFEAMGETPSQTDERHLVEIKEEESEMPDTLAMMTPANLQTQIDIETEKRGIIEKYIEANMKKGVDFYTLEIFNKKKGQYEESKPSLSKPGSEKFMSLFHLRAEFAQDSETWNMLGAKPGNLCYVCRLYTKNSELVGEGRGARAIGQDGDINKAIKMAQKSAQIDAILRTGSLSDLFTQDLEDMPVQTIGDLPPAQKSQVQQVQTIQTPKSNFQFSDRTAPKVKNPDLRCSFKQANYIKQLLQERGRDNGDILIQYSISNLEELTMGQASQIIETILKQPVQKVPTVQQQVEQAYEDINAELGL